jgi:hypothetical protein
MRGHSYRIRGTQNIISTLNENISWVTTEDPADAEYFDEGEPVAMIDAPLDIRQALAAPLADRVTIIDIPRSRYDELPDGKIVAPCRPEGYSYFSVMDIIHQYYQQPATKDEIEKLADSGVFADYYAGIRDRHAAMGRNITRSDLMGDLRYFEGFDIVSIDRDLLSVTAMMVVISTSYSFSSPLLANPASSS